MADTNWTGGSKVTRPTFDGKRKNFKTWSIKSKAFANVAGFADLLKSQKSNKLPSTEEHTVGMMEEKE